MSKYRKKPVVIEAVQWTGENVDEILKFCHDAYFDCEEPYGDIELHIKTLEGKHVASDGDFIIKGVRGEYYPCKPDIFAETYELAE